MNGITSPPAASHIKKILDDDMWGEAHRITQCRDLQRSDNALMVNYVCRSTHSHNIKGGWTHTLRNCWWFGELPTAGVHVFIFSLWVNSSNGTWCVIYQTQGISNLCSRARITDRSTRERDGGGGAGEHLIPFCHHHGEDRRRFMGHPGLRTSRLTILNVKTSLPQASSS